MSKTLRNIVAGLVAGLLIGAGGVKVLTPNPVEEFCNGWVQGVADTVGAVFGIYPTAQSDVADLKQLCLDNPDNPLGTPMPRVKDLP